MLHSHISDRRRFLGTAAMALAATRLGMVSTPQANERESALLTAFGRATAWINSSPIAAPSLAGKVVLVQFGTYTCINWLRTLPHVRAWAQKYGSRLEVIGVHTPEFTFEKNLENVRRALQQMKIGLPVAVDNDYAIWRAFDNNYWPAVYLIDARGRLRDHHFGEGQYDRLERTIQKLLAETGAKVDADTAAPIAASGIEDAADWENLRSPEIYLGHARMENFSSPEGARSNRSRIYTAPADLKLNRWALAGEWTIGGQPTALEKAPGRVTCRFHARDVHLVMGPRQPDTRVRFRVAIDQQTRGAARGLDVDAGGNGIVADQRLYQLIRQRPPIVDRTFDIEFLDPGVEVFAFTFG